MREHVVFQLEQAETELIRKCKRAQMKQQKRDGDRSHRILKQGRELEDQHGDKTAEKIARGESLTAGDSHQIRHTVMDAVEEDRRSLRLTSMLWVRRYSSTGEDLTKLSKVPVIGGGLAAIVMVSKGDWGSWNRLATGLREV